jgi:hypothetical protein
MAEPHSFSEDAARRTANVVRLVENTHPQTRRGGGNRPAIQVILEGEYKEDLDAPEEPNEGEDIVPTTALFRCYRGAGDEWALDEEENNEIEVTNRNTGFSASQDEYGIIVELNGEWRPISGGGGGEGVAFEIESMSEYPGFTGTHYAICDILARDNPKTTSSAEEEGTRKITVHDLTGCFFDEDAADLVARKGFARYMKIEGEANPKWIVHSLCCPPE